MDLQKKVFRISGAVLILFGVLLVGIYLVIMTSLVSDELRINKKGRRVTYTVSDERDGKFFAEYTNELNEVKEVPMKRRTLKEPVVGKEYEGYLFIDSEFKQRIATREWVGPIFLIASVAFPMVIIGTLLILGGKKYFTRFGKESSEYFDI